MRALSVILFCLVLLGAGCSGATPSTTPTQTNDVTKNHDLTIEHPVDTDTFAITFPVGTVLNTGPNAITVQNYIAPTGNYVRGDSEWLVEIFYDGGAGSQKNFEAHYASVTQTSLARKDIQYGNGLATSDGTSKIGAGYFLEDDDKSVFIRISATSNSAIASANKVLGEMTWK